MWVFVCHSFNFALRYQDFGIISKIVRFLPSGGQAVDIFIILSGFVISLVLIEKNETLKQFYIRRAFRIYPVYIAAFATAFILFPWMITDVLRELPWGPATTYYPELIASSEQVWSQKWLHAILHLLNIHGTIPNSVLPFASGAILGVAWSISLEWQFYVVAPLLVKNSTKSRDLRWGLILLMGLSAVALNMYVPLGFPKAFLLASFGYFMCGIASYALYRYIRQKSLSFSMIQITCILILTLLLVGKNWVVLTWLSFFLFTFLRKGKIENILRKTVESRFLVFLGDISYSIYLWHILVLWVVPMVLFKLGVDSIQTHALVNIVIGGPLVIGISYVSYCLIEKPLMIYGKNLSNRR
jgi:peptidoglycan/LPS O-acetylase OafA/YrhL